MAGVRSPRKRVKTSHFDFDFLDNEEQRLLQQVGIFLPNEIEDNIIRYFLGIKALEARY